MTLTPLQIAKMDLRDAEARVAEALVAQELEDSFPVVGEVFAIMAREPYFDQFVSYSETGKLVKILSTESEADRYLEVTPNPSGYILCKEPMKLHA